VAQKRKGQKKIAEPFKGLKNRVFPNHLLGHGTQRPVKKIWGLERMAFVH